MSLKMDFHLKWKVTKNGMSLKMQWYQNGTSLKIEYHSKWNVTQNEISLKMEYNAKWNFNSKWNFTQIECH